MAAVQVPRALLAALALGTLLAAFLLGRQFSRGAPSPVETPHVSEPPAASPAERPPDTTPGPEPASSTLAALPPPASLPATLPAILPSAAAPAPGGRESEEIARYFQEADAIEARAKYWSDPQALATTILEQATKGDAGGFDDLIRAQAGARDEFARLSVPASCAEHHRRSVAVMGEGLALLERVKTALSSGDIAGLDGLQEKARDLEREAKEIDELGRKIRQR